MESPEKSNLRRSNLFIICILCGHSSMMTSGYSLDDIMKPFYGLLNNVIENNGTFQMYEWETYSRKSQYPDLVLEGLPRYTRHIPEDELFSPHRLARLAERVFDILESEIGTKERMNKTSDKYSTFFTKFIKIQSYLVDNWKKDEEFCRQFIQGANPMMLEVVSNIVQIPLQMRQLKGQGKTVAKLIHEKRLFMADYKILADLPEHMNFKFYAPIILFYNQRLSNHPHSHRLMVLGIQLTRYEENNEIYTPASSPNKYLFAKLHVINADVQVHQFVIHLGMTHMVLEPFAVAHNNHLRRYNHSLSLLLKPHVSNTIFINYLARQTLISPADSSMDPLLSIGTKSGFKLIHKVLTQTTFFNRSFPNELRSRGFKEDETDGLHDYYYRSDGFELWNILYTYVDGFVQRIYETDASVEKDLVLRGFSESVSSSTEGNLNGFPAQFTSKKQLTDALVTIIFTASAQHSAINYPQENYLYIPYRPQVLMNFMPENVKDDISYSFILKSLPPYNIARRQFTVAHFLSVRTEDVLMKLNALEVQYPDIHEDLQYNLKALSNTIKRRNEQLEKWNKAPYTYLDPIVVPISIET